MVWKSFLVAGIAAAVALPAAHAQDRAPRVRLAALPVTAPGTISPSVSLSEPAYIFAVAIDNSGEIVVLSPTMPADAIQFDAAKSIRFPEFFSGFSTVSNYGEYGNRYRRSSFAGYGDAGAAYGSVMVVASRTPFNYAAISDGIYWSEPALRQIIRYRTPTEAVTALGRALTAKGQTFGHDYVYFGRSPHSQSAFALLRGDCTMDYSFSPYGYSSFANYYGAVGFPYSGLIVSGYGGMAGMRLVRVGTDGCGRARYMLMPVQVLPPAVGDTTRIDSVKKAESRSVIAARYEGEAARRVFESVLRNRNSSDSYVGVTESPAYNEKEEILTARSLAREARASRAEAMERMRGRADRPTRENTPVLREQPVYRTERASSEPAMRSAPQVEREPRPVELRSRIKDN